MSDSLLHNRAGKYTQEDLSPGEQFAFAIIPASINIISGIFAFVINSALLYILIRNHRSGSRILICNLAVTDLLTGLLVQPFYAVHIILNMKVTNVTALYLFNFTAYLVCGLSLVTAGGMSIDRLVATMFPFWYKTRSKPKIFASLVVFIWVQGIGFVSLYLSGIIDNTLAQLAFSLTVCFAVLSFIVSYAIIMKNIKQRDRRVTQSSILTSTSSRNVQQRRQVKLTKTFAFMIIALCLMYLPMVLVKILFWKANSAQFKTLDVINRFANTLSFLNSCLNPILFCYGNNAIGAEMKNQLSRLFTYFTRKSSPAPPEACARTVNSSSNS